MLLRRRCDLSLLL